MTQKRFSSLHLFTCFAVLCLALALPGASSAQEDAKAPAEQAEKAAPAAKEAAAPAEKPLTEQQKKAAIEAADAITKFDASKLVGAPRPWQIFYQPAESPAMKRLVSLHNGVLVIITVIVIFVMLLMLYVMLRFNKRTNPRPQTFTHNKLVEVVWTVVPILILVGIAIPSLRAHYQYYHNENIISNPDVTIKVVGHQWYWEYEYPDQAIKFDSNITPVKDLPEGAPRLLEVDNPIVVPVNKVVRLQVTAADVMHAVAIPAFGVKMGAVPGRLNETWFKAERTGIYYGQCSILCGKLHGFMPIKIIVVSDEEFEQWVNGAKLKFAMNGAIQVASLN